MATINPDEELLSSIASLSPPLSLKSGTLDLPLTNDSLPPNSNNTPEPTVNTNPTASQSTKSSSNVLKSRHSPTPPPNNLHFTIDNHPIPPKKKYNILEDPVFIDSGILPPTLHPLKNPSQSNTMTDEFLRTHPNFKANLPSLYMTPTTYKFRFPQDRSFDHYVAYASKNLPQLAYWQTNRVRFFQFQFNLLKPTQHDLNTNPNDITTTPSVKKLHHQTYQLFLQHKHPQNFIFQNHKFTSPFSFHSHYSLNHLFTIGTIRNYDPVKQYFVLSSYHDPTRPLFVPQEALNVNDDFLLPTHIPNVVQNFFPKMTKLVETPLDDHSRSLYTALVHKHYSLAQLNFIIAKLSSFILKKQYKYFSLNISDEILQTLPKHTSPNITSEPSHISTIPPPSTSYVLQTANPNVCINSFSCPTDKFVSEILTLLRPHVEIAPNTDPFIILNHIFDTFRNFQSLLQLHSTDIQNLTISTIHVNDFLKKLVLLETPPQFTSSSTSL